MKKLLVGILSFSVLVPGAFASKARLQALGQDVDGSLFVDDHRNIFFNPATVNYHKDFITLEAGAANATDAVSTPSSEGGFVKARGNMVYGFHFGNQDETIKGIRVGESANLASVEGNILDFFVGGDAGVLWGLQVSHASFTDEQATNDIEGSVMRTKVGAISGNIEGHLDFTLTDTAKEDSSKEVAVKSAYDLHVAYNLRSDAKAYLRYMAMELEEKEAGTEDYKSSLMEIGYGRVRSLNNKASLNYSVAYQTTTKENTDFSTATEVKTMKLPMVMGLEYRAKDWLTVRGSVSQNLLSEEENDAGDKKTTANSTVVNAGMSLHFGDLTIDGLVGNTTGAAMGESTASGNGTLRTDALMTRVSATYKF